MVLKRVIPCLDVDAGRVVKGTNFVGLRDAGDPVELAERYDAEGADELVFLDITASHERRETIVELARRTADNVFIPFTIGGGIRSVSDAQAVLDAGADKISVNSAALERPQLLDELADHFGAQCVVVAIDAKRSTRDPAAPGREAGGARDPAAPGREAGGARDPAAPGREAGGARDPAAPGREAGGARDPAAPGREAEEAAGSCFDVYTHGGRERFEGRDAVAWAREAAERGAGEVLLTSMDRDGTSDGYDTELTRAVAAAVPIPVIASGGAGELRHLSEAVTEGGADAVLCASIFHYGTFTIREAKEQMAADGIPVRL